MLFELDQDVQAKVDDLVVQIAGVNADLTDLTMSLDSKADMAAVDSLAGVVADNYSALVASDTELSDMLFELDQDVQTKADDLVDQIALVNSDLESLTSAVDGKADQAAVDTLADIVASNYAALDAADSELSDMLFDLDDDLQAKADDWAQQIDSVNTDLADLVGRVDATEIGLDDLSKQIDTLGRNMDDLGARVTTVEGQVKTLQDAMSDKVDTKSMEDAMAAKDLQIAALKAAVCQLAQGNQAVIDTIPGGCPAPQGPTP